MRGEREGGRGAEFAVLIDCAGAGAGGYARCWVGLGCKLHCEEGRGVRKGGRHRDVHSYQLLECSAGHSESTSY